MAQRRKIELRQYCSEFIGQSKNICSCLFVFIQKFISSRQIDGKIFRVDRYGICFKKISLQSKMRRAINRKRIWLWCYGVSWKLFLLKIYCVSFWHQLSLKYGLSILCHINSFLMYDKSGVRTQALTKERFIFISIENLLSIGFEISMAKRW